MAAPTVQDVVEVAPELAAYAATPEGAAHITKMIGLAALRVNEALLGDLYSYGVALLAAHMVLSTNTSLGGLVAGGGIVQSVSVGSISQTFATTTSTRVLGPHGTTRPGAIYDEIVDERSGPGFIYIGAGCDWPRW